MSIPFKRAESVAKFIDAVRLWVATFIQEQGCKPGCEPDEDDKSIDDYIAVVDSTTGGTLRVLGVAPKINQLAPPRHN